MPQLTINRAVIADVLPDETDENKKTVKINCDEEDFFEMLDHVNPKNIIKYLDMRGIPHRERINIVVKRVELDVKHGVRRRTQEILDANNRKVNRAQDLMEKYYG